MLFNWSKGKKSETPTATTYSNGDAVPVGFSLPWTEAEIREDPVIKDKLRVLDRSGLALPKEIWGEFVVDTVVAFVLWVQDMPASANYHHAFKKGLLYHSLDVAIYAQRIRRNYIMPPNTPPEEVLHREIVWTYGVFLASLFHDAGKIADFDVELYSKDGKHTVWTFAQGPLGKLGTPYRFKYKKERAYSQHQRLGMGFLLNMLSNNPMLSINSDAQLFAALAKYFSGQADADNVIEQIIRQADAASVAQDLGATKAGIDQAAKRVRFGANSLAEQLHTTLSYLITENKILLNKRGGEGFVAGEHLYLVCKPIAETIRTTLLDRGISSIPASNTKLFNILQQHNLIRPNSDGMAIWNCHIHLTDVEWQQQFTCLCIHLPSLVPDANLAELTGTVTILDNPTPEVEAEETSPEPIPTQFDPLPLPSAAVQPPVVTEPVPEQSQDKTTAEAALFASIPGFDQLTAAPADERVEVSLSDSTEPVSTKLDLTSSNDSEIGDAFWQWIEAGLINKTLRLNEPNAFLHIVQGKLLIVSPTAMKFFCETQTLQAEAEHYAQVQKAFQSLKRHILNAQGRNIHRLLVTQNNATLNGFLVSQSEAMRLQGLSDNTLLKLEVH